MSWNILTWSKYDILYKVVQVNIYVNQEHISKKEGERFDSPPCPRLRVSKSWGLLEFRFYSLKPTPKPIQVYPMMMKPFQTQARAYTLDRAELHPFDQNLANLISGLLRESEVGWGVIRVNSHFRATKEPSFVVFKLGSFIEWPKTRAWFNCKRVKPDSFTAQADENEPSRVLQCWTWLSY